MSTARRRQGPALQVGLAIGPQEDTPLLASSEGHQGTPSPRGTVGEKSGRVTEVHLSFASTDDPGASSESTTHPRHCASSKREVPGLSPRLRRPVIVRQWKGEGVVQVVCPGTVVGADVISRPQRRVQTGLPPISGVSPQS